MITATLIVTTSAVESHFQKIKKTTAHASMS
jgi:hypothetical protein